jgi:hypothetical protein
MRHPCHPTLPLQGRVGARSNLLDLGVFELDRRGAAEDRDRHLEAGAALVDLLDDPVERGEGAVGDADRLADLELDRGLGRSTPSATWPLMRSASASGIGTGFDLSAPRKPVTFGVFLMRW